MTLFARKNIAQRKKRVKKNKTESYNCYLFFSLRSKKEKSISNSILVNFII